MSVSEVNTQESQNMILQEVLSRSRGTSFASAYAPSTAATTVSTNSSFNNGGHSKTSSLNPATNSYFPVQPPMNGSAQAGGAVNSQAPIVTTPGTSQVSSPAAVVSPQPVAFHTAQVLSYPVSSGFNGQPPTYQQPTGIPMSKSSHCLSSVTSPGQTTNGEISDTESCYVFSPASSHVGRLTEPRNYAPRTSGQPIDHQPPPKFDLGIGATAASSTGALVSYAPAAQSQDPFVSGPMVPLVQRSEKLTNLLAVPYQFPTFETAMHPDNFPFVESCRIEKGQNCGVVKISNIPFATKRAEVIAFFGRNSRILNDVDEPVHIIMERVTSKTMDAYVEFCTLDDAMRAVEKHSATLNNGRPPRLGDRPVEVELSSQAHLMKDLFPLGKGLTWNGANPEFKPFNATEPWDNFKGFISEEEMIMLVKHVEVPHRSPFSKECPQRPYECLISTLKKFPWSYTDRITISQRQALFKAVCELLRLLCRSVTKGDDSLNLNTQLYRRLVATSMNCPGFTTCMKSGIAWLVDMSDVEQKQYGLPTSAAGWLHQYALRPKPGMPLDVVEWYIAVIREQTHRDMMGRAIRERNDQQETARGVDMHWGYFWVEVGYVPVMGTSFDTMTLDQAANAELSAIERIFARALPTRAIQAC